MKGDSRIVQVFERLCLLLSLSLLGFFALAHIHRFVMVRVEMARFEAKRHSTSIRTADPASNGVSDDVNVALWSAQRVKAYQASLTKTVEPLAVLRISRLNFEAPVLEGTDEFTLNRGLGRIKNTSFPRQDGNMGIAGHRDGFFRALKDTKVGDEIDLVTISGTTSYFVDRIRITDPSDVSVLHSRQKPSLTLVTCYPFYFVGPAPSRYIVEASLKDEGDESAGTNSDLNERRIK